MAANLAITFTQLDEANLSIAGDGLMVRNDRGTKVVNPAITAKSSLSATVLQLSKALGLSASQLGVSGKPQEARNIADANARAIIDKAAGSRLLA
jgi:phage terminase small subunit